MGFPTPSGDLEAGTDLQEFRVQIRRSGPNATPTADFELWENDSFVATLVSGVNVAESDPGEVMTFRWNANLLSNIDGSEVELRIKGYRQGTYPSLRHPEFGAIEWNAAVDTGDDPADYELYFLRARYYDPATGRFTGRDRLEFDQRYAYVSSNPSSLIDPAGLCGWSKPWDCIDEATAIVVLGTIEILAPQIPTNALVGASFGAADCDGSTAREGITFHFGCGGATESFVHWQGQKAVTVGTDVFTYQPVYSRELQIHEACHVGQYDRFGDQFLLIYLGGQRSDFEDAAERAEANGSMFSTLTSVRETCRAQASAGDFQRRSCDVGGD